MPPRTPKKSQPLPPRAYVEIGRSGLRQSGGEVHDEFLLELRGQRGRKVIREMADNDAVIGAVLFAVRQLLRSVTITVQAGGSSPQDEEARDLVATCLQDMSLTWADTLSDILTMLPYGWSFLEVVLKRRMGDSPDPAKRSRFSDGRVGWRKWALRGQASLDRWDLDESGGIQGLRQMPDMGFTGAVIPIEKALLFRTEPAGGNPEGHSILRNAYPAWYYSKAIRSSEAIGIQRDFAGMPKIRIPGALMRDDATTDEKAVFEAYKKLGERMRNDKQSSIVLPSDRDEHGHPLYDVELLSTAGKRLFDTNAILARYNVEKAIVVLADFILLGHEKIGTQALSTNKTDIFGDAVGGWLDNVCEVVNRHAIPRLMQYNGMQVETPPRLTHGQVFGPTLKELTEFVRDVTSAGAELLPDDAVENHLRTRAGLPLKEGSEPMLGSKRTRRPKVGSAAWRAEQGDRS